MRSRLDDPFDPDRPPTWEETIGFLTGTDADRARTVELGADVLANGQQEPVRL